MIQFINLPIGAVTIVVIMIYFKSPDRPAVAQLGMMDRVKQFDIHGTAVFMPAIISLLLALQWGGTKYEWSSWRIILLFVVFGILIITFIVIQIVKGDMATVPPRILKKRTVWTASWFAFCLGAFFMLLVYYLPIWFQAVKGASAVKSGIMNLPMILTLVIVSICSGIGVTLIGYCKFLLSPNILLSSNHLQMPL